ncbi:hypothetical protein GE115_16715 [Agromyces sp. CFH 90414]|uniref:DUF3558 domain-containing protein n=1 Tax=Agromyces agglutinans TaxID=2662258 RepID=A0A6I2FAY7_9MICO|nr:hypothetical protein [Agromyces agglutinans]MRG61501.1 hypothetical protein [Agromyces agglutinans]
MTRRVPAAALAAGSVLLLAACTLPGASAEAPAPTSAAPMAAPKATPEAVSTRLFDGDCDAVLSPEEVSTVTGLVVARQAVTPLDDMGGGHAAVAALGGVHCMWLAADQGSVVSVTVIPASQAGDEVAAQSASQPYCYGAACSFSVTVGEDWVAGVVYTADGIDPADAADQLVALIAPRAAEQPHDFAPLEAATRVDCATLAADLDLPALLGVEGVTLVDGNGPAEAGPGVYGAMAAIGQGGCLTDGAPHIELNVLPTGGWLLGVVPPGESTGVPSGTGLTIRSWTDAAGRAVAFVSFDGALAQASSDQVPLDTLIRIAQGVAGAV